MTIKIKSPTKIVNAAVGVSYLLLKSREADSGLSEDGKEFIMTIAGVLRWLTGGDVAEMMKESMNQIVEVGERITKDLPKEITSNPNFINTISMAMCAAQIIPDELQKHMVEEFNKRAKPSDN